MSRRPRVAYLDDSEDLRLQALTCFTDNHIDVYAIERGAADLESLAAWNPSVIVIDPEGAEDAVRKPFEVAVAICDDPRFAGVPIVLLASPSTLWQYEPEVQYVDPAATMSKPFSTDELVAVVQALTGSARTEERVHDDSQPASRS